MSSLKETIETFSVTDSWSGSKYVYVEDIPGIVVSALQDLVDALRAEAKSSDPLGGLWQAVYAIEDYQEEITVYLT